MAAREHKVVGRGFLPGDGSLLPGGRRFLPDGRDLLPGGRGFLSDGRDLLPGGRDFLPDGRDFLPGGRDLLPDGRGRGREHAGMPLHGSKPHASAPSPGTPGFKPNPPGLKGNPDGLAPGRNLRDRPIFSCGGEKFTGQGEIYGTGQFFLFLCISVCSVGSIFIASRKRGIRGRV